LAQRFHRFHGQPEISAKFEILWFGGFPGKPCQPRIFRSPHSLSAPTKQAIQAREKASSALMA